MEKYDDDDEIWLGNTMGEYFEWVFLRWYVFRFGETEEDEYIFTNNRIMEVFFSFVLKKREVRKNTALFFVTIKTRSY